MFSNNGCHCISKIKNRDAVTDTQYRVSLQPTDTETDHERISRVLFTEVKRTFLEDRIDGLYFSVCPWSQNIDKTGLLSSSPLLMNGFGPVLETTYMRRVWCFTLKIWQVYKPKTMQLTRIWLVVFHIIVNISHNKKAFTLYIVCVSQAQKLVTNTHLFS